ncbi:MAG: cytochrome c oxidase subunit II [Proteobacteria bacterium]|nr:cytochrome c oxidase subunit II [Pseudomonadota bacterium]
MMEQLSNAWKNVLDRKGFDYGLPIDISTHGAAIDRLITTLHYFMALLFIGWGIYLVYCLVRFRDREGHQADVSEKHFGVPKYLEMGIVIFEACLLVFFSYPVWAKLKTDFPDRANSLVVRVVAEQFAWNIHYPGRDGKFGKTSIDLIDGTNPVGLDREDADAKDDIVTINQLVVPVGKPVIVELSAKDVIHGFFLPVARVKHDAIPGMTFPLWFETKEVGEFQIACAQLCGVGHYKMMGQFLVKTPEDFEQWHLDEEKALTE